MTRRVDLRHLIANSLGVPDETIHDELGFGTVPQWDSVGHLKLIADIERSYGVELDPSDLLEMMSVGQIKVVLAKSGIHPQ